MNSWAPPSSPPQVVTPEATGPTSPIESDEPDDCTHLGDIGLAVLAVVIGLVVAIGVGGIVGAVTIGAAGDECTPGDTWCGLGAALVGLLLAFVAGGIGYVAAGVALIRRCRPAGRRAGHVIAHLALPCGLVMLPGMLAGIVI